MLIEAQRLIDEEDYDGACEQLNSAYEHCDGQDKPDDFAVATGEQHSVKEFLEEAFQYSGLGDWKQYVKVDPRYFRPTEADSLVGNSGKAKEKFGWEPKIKFKELVRIMIDADLRALSLECPGEGDKILKVKFPNRWWKYD